VLIIEKDEGNPYIPLCNELGAVVLVGDASKPETLQSARLHKAQRLIAVCGEDGTNVEIAFAAEEVLAAKNAASRLPCHVHMVDPQLRVVFQRHRLLTGQSGRLKVFIFNVAENSARLLLSRHFLDHRLPITTSEDPRQAHLIIVGFGQMGESIAVEALRLAHFPNHKKLRFSVIDKDADRARDRFLLRYESFPDFCDLQFLEAYADSPAIVEQIKSWCEQRDSIVTMVVCCGEDSFNLSYGLTLLQSLRHQGIPIFVRLTTATGLAKTVSDAKADSERWGQVAAFGKLEDSCSVDVVVHDKINSLARKIHERFARSRKSEGRDEENPSVVGWDELDADLQFSNSQQAAHIAMKVRAINCYLAPKNGAPPSGQLAEDIVNQMSPSDVETLAPLEHRRWWVERALSGWRQGNTTDYVGRTHPDMKPWGKLTPEVKKYDVEFVQRIPAMLKDAEMLIRRTPK
jgi:voltage-gated potassium channel Kch